MIVVEISSAHQVLILAIMLAPRVRTLFKELQALDLKLTPHKE